MAKQTVKMSNGTKVVIALSVAGIIYFLYKRSQAGKLDQGGNSVVINTNGSKASVVFPEDMPSNQRKGFLALQKAYHWSNEDLQKNLNSTWWQTLAQAQGNA
jgi:hypothetical protein